MLEDISLAITSKFLLKSLAMKDDLNWHLKMLVSSTLPRVYLDYKVTFQFNKQPYETRIADIDRRLKALGEQKELGEGFSSGEKDGLLQELDEAREEMTKLEGECSPFDFEATLEELKHTDNGSVVTLHIPAESVEELNEKRSLLRHYIINLDFDQTV